MLYSLQLYFDFSGYCDMAIGIAKILGIKLLENFNNPFSARSITDFWNRWHMTLTRWLREYIYFPLGGSRVSSWKRSLNIFAVFIVCGLWHGIGYNYLLWGTIHGFLVSLSHVFERKSANIKNRFLISLQIISTFIIVSLAWIPFRIRSLPEIISVYKIIFSSVQSFNIQIDQNGKFYTVLSFALAALLVEFLYRQNRFKNLFFRLPFFVRWVAYYAMVIGVIFFGEFGELKFIYAKF
jgi:alginate O-acetyltransferase complex protein AlgI